MVVNYLYIFLVGYYMPLVGVLFNSHHIPLYCRNVPRYCHYVPLSLFRFISYVYNSHHYIHVISSCMCVCIFPCVSIVFPLQKRKSLLNFNSFSISCPVVFPYIYIHYIMHVYLFEGYYSNKTTQMGAGISYLVSDWRQNETDQK